MCVQRWQDSRPRTLNASWKNLYVLFLNSSDRHCLRPTQVFSTTKPLGPWAYGNLVPPPVGCSLAAIWNCPKSKISGSCEPTPWWRRCFHWNGPGFLSGSGCVWQVLFQSFWGAGRGLGVNVWVNQTVSMHAWYHSFCGTGTVKGIWFWPISGAKERLHSITYHRIRI